MRIKTKPLSVNSMYYGNKRHGMRSEAKDWQVNVFHGLSQYEAQLGALRSQFKKSKHGYAVSLTWVIPKDHLYTKAGELSSRCCDLSNIEKALIDVLFLPKNFSNNAPYGCQNLNIDDRYLKTLTSRKVAGDEWGVIINVRIVAK
jgi:hypothetical protein